MKRKPDKQELEDIKSVMEQNLKDARDEYERALQMFDYAEDNFVELANDFLTAAKLKLDTTIRQTKLLNQTIDKLDEPIFDENIR